MFRCFLCIFFISLSNALFAAETMLTDMLTTEPMHGNQIVSFLPTAGMANPITGIHIHYLTSSDCYSGYLASFYHHQNLNVFKTSEENPFSLRGDATYQIGTKVIRYAKLNEVHSVLIRLVSDEHGNPRHRFAFFLGECEDQDVNCCITVNCSEETKTCLPQHELTPQYLFWR